MCPNLPTRAPLPSTYEGSWNQGTQAKMPAEWLVSEVRKRLNYSRSPYAWWPKAHGARVLEETARFKYWKDINKKHHIKKIFLKKKQINDKFSRSFSAPLTIKIKTIKHFVFNLSGWQRSKTFDNNLKDSVGRLNSFPYQWAIHWNKIFGGLFSTTYDACGLWPSSFFSGIFWQIYSHKCTKVLCFL